MPHRIAQAARIAFLVLAVALVPTALAAKGGNGGGGSTPTAATVTATPATVSVGDRVDLQGCGYLVDPVQIRVIDSAGNTQTYGAGVWNTGCFSGYFTATAAGTYTIEVWQHASKDLHLKASTTLSVL